MTVEKEVKRALENLDSIYSNDSKVKKFQSTLAEFKKLEKEGWAVSRGYRLSNPLEKKRYRVHANG